MKTIRSDSLTVESYNSGLVVFLYDQANGGAIEEIGPTILEYMDMDPLQDEALEEIADKKLMVAYELQQDDELMIEVSFGPPLNKDEMRDLPWIKPLRAFLSLPTGKLCVEGYDTLSIGPEEPEEPGVVLDVPPGDYIVTVHRFNILEIDDDDEWDRPIQVITFSTPEQTDPLANNVAMLTWAASFE